MGAKAAQSLSPQQQEDILDILQIRFEKYSERHQGIDWADVHARLVANPTKLWSLNEMEVTGGEPDVIGFDKAMGTYTFCDCAAESPAKRRSICYDVEGLESRKENKPAGSAVEMAAGMGIELLDIDGYHKLQQLGNFDRKTSSWIKTPSDIRKLGGALFGDHRFGTTFIYHNGAQSYYAGRGFRGILKV